MDTEKYRRKTLRREQWQRRIPVSMQMKHNCTYKMRFAYVSPVYKCETSCIFITKILTVFSKIKSIFSIVVSRGKGKGHPNFPHCSFLQRSTFSTVLILNRWILQSTGLKTLVLVHLHRTVCEAYGISADPLQRFGKHVSFLILRPDMLNLDRLVCDHVL